MKKLIYLSAAALAALSLAACSSDNDVAQDVNPTYDGKSVKTQFALSIAPTSGTTRMTSDETQATAGAFQGIKDIALIPVKANTAGTVDDEFFTAIPLASISSTGLKEGDGATGAQTQNYKLYSNLAIPVGTNTFLFYGQSNYSEAKGSLKYYNNTSVQDFANVKNATQTSDINFKLDYVVTDDGTTFATHLSTLVTALNDVLNAFSSPNALTENGGPNQTTIENQMVNLREEFKKYTTAGSGDAVLSTLQNLYNSIELIKTTTSDNGNTVAENVLTKIRTYCKITTATMDDANIGKRTLNWDNTKVTDVTASFPANLGLPVGSAQVYFDDANGNGFKTSIGSSTVTAMNIDVTTITKPAALAYFIESPIRTKTTDILSTQQWPNVDTWEKDATTFWGEWTTDAVSATTRSIALKENIQYAVAHLQTTIKCPSTTLLDNRHAHFEGEEDSEITVGGGFQVTGILIGGQPDKVDYKFLDNNASYTSSIYDKWIPTNTVNSSKNAVNNTLVLTNEKNSTDGNKVNIAVEFVNNTGSDFYGYQGGRIANGQKFYMVAQLNLDADTGVTIPNNLKTVFKQDYVTNATLSITSLKNAYLTIPDLRTSQLQLGLSVELSWKTGVNFVVDFQ